MGILVLNQKRIFDQLDQLDKKVQRKVVRKATNAAGKVVLKEAQREAGSLRVTGFLRRSLKSVTRSRKGWTTVRVGQRKQNQFKARSVSRVKGKNLSQIQRKGNAVPIWWLERGTKPHQIRAWVRASDGTTKPLAFQVGRRTATKSGLAFAQRVDHPGTRAVRILGKTARRSRSAAAQAYASTAAREMRS